ncbi:hypothetical protein [Paenibacillus sp. NEAU-GSW1]|uniref:hypothetical protein n=1 Tax=Paenibacillus sp. NEAU-GSW1 TaxID=2682486 RepID=UPI0012E2409E|nr:hypothetical protein [Paenibacillus sp. NEAU-GSW1]MUT65766.1 hypothetical protein [Paenibacillus sp. NEAU-GSW1]
MEKTSIEQLQAIKDHLKQTSRFENKAWDQIRQEMDAAAKNMPPHEDIAIRQATALL